jgi:LacI family transcriptional regulator
MQYTRADFVGTNDYKAGQLAANHLLELGHKYFAHLTLDNRNPGFLLRRNGFVDKISEHKDTACAIMEAEKVDDPAIESYVQKLLTQTPRPTAIFFPVDTIALAVYSVARKLKINIPEELSVVGFANLQMCEALYPSLTSIEQFPYKIGRAAANLFLQRSIEGKFKNSPQKIMIETELIPRNSTKRI